MNHIKYLILTNCQWLASLYQAICSFGFFICLWVGAGSHFTANWPGPHSLCSSGWHQTHRQFSCLSLPSTEITGMSHHAQLTCYILFFVSQQTSKPFVICIVTRQRTCYAHIQAVSSVQAERKTPKTPRTPKTKFSDQVLSTKEIYLPQKDRG